MCLWFNCSHRLWMGSRGKTGWVRVDLWYPGILRTTEAGPSGFSSNSMIQLLNPRCYNIRMSVKGTFLAGQWLRLHFLNSGAGFDFHMPQLRVCMPRLKILYTAIKKQIPGGNSLVVQWLGLCTFIAEDADSILGHGAKIL